MDNELLDSLKKSNPSKTIKSINQDNIRFGVDMFVTCTERKKNISLEYDPKVLEFKQFFDIVFGGRPISTQYDITQNKVYQIFLVCCIQRIKEERQEEIKFS